MASHLTPSKKNKPKVLKMVSRVLHYQYSLTFPINPPLLPSSLQNARPLLHHGLALALGAAKHVLKKQPSEFYLGFVGLVQVGNLVNQLLDRVGTDFPILQTMIN